MSQSHVSRVLQAVFDVLQPSFPADDTLSVGSFRPVHEDVLKQRLISNVVYKGSPAPDRGQQPGVVSQLVEIAVITLSSAALDYLSRDQRIQQIHDVLLADHTLGGRVSRIWLSEPGCVEQLLPEFEVVMTELHFTVSLRRDAVVW